MNDSSNLQVLPSRYQTHVKRGILLRKQQDETSNTLLYYKAIIHKREGDHHRRMAFIGLWHPAFGKNKMVAV